MKTLTRLFILLFVMAGVSSCYTGIPLKQGKSENNRTYEVSYLFEHDGVKVYRFMDMGNYVYFTTKGDVTSIKNDSTKERTVTIYRDDTVETILQALLEEFESSSKGLLPGKGSFPLPIPSGSPPSPAYPEPDSSRLKFLTLPEIRAHAHCLPLHRLPVSFPETAAINCGLLPIHPAPCSGTGTRLHVLCLFLILQYPSIMFLYLTHSLSDL